MKLVTVVMILLVTRCSAAQCSSGFTGKNRYVAVALSDGQGHPLGPSSYQVKGFMNLKSNEDQSKLFGANSKMGPFTAENVPFGAYRIEIQSKSGQEVFGRLIDVCKPDESVEVPDHFGRVHIVLLSSTANSVEDARADLVKIAKFRSVDGTEMAGLFKGAIADEVPYGSYDLEMFDPLNGIIKRRVDVFQPDVWVLSGFLALGEGSAYSAPKNVVRGEVENIPPSERPVFITMSGVYVSHIINSVVSDSGDGGGRFSLPGVNPRGVFMLFTIGKSGILDAREISLPRETKVIIDLSHPNPPKKDVP